MTKLSATDANFIYAENTTCPMSIASLQFMELPDHMNEESFVSTLKLFVSERLDWVPYLTNKLQFASGLLDHPNWVVDQAFDINNHIYAIRVPAPGSIKQIEQTVARLHETPLPRSRPLWDIIVLTGLANGQVAYYNRVHHACLDGMAAQASTALLMDTHPTIPEAKIPLPPSAGAPRSTTTHVLGLLTALTQQSIDLVSGMPARAAAASAIMQRGFDPALGLNPNLMPCPRTPINRTIDRGRSYAMGELPLSDIKHIAKGLRCTINDIFLALCGGALRTYLQRHNALPEQSLVAGCPVSMRKTGDRSNNNQVALMRIPLGTDIDNAPARLRAVSRAAQEAKSLLSEAAPLMPGNVTFPAMGLAVRSMASAAGLMGWANRTNPPFNVLISNVPGPRETLYSNGARMLSHYPVSIPTHGVGVNITVQSYVNTLYIGITAAAKVAPDADRLRDDLYDAYRTLCAALSADVIELSTLEPHGEGRNAAQNEPLNDRVA
jgi:diacylglycerol O-acyltransferase / wax synthase